MRNNKTTFLELCCLWKLEDYSKKSIRLLSGVLTSTCTQTWIGNVPVAEEHQSKPEQGAWMLTQHRDPDPSADYYTADELMSSRRYEAAHM